MIQHISVSGTSRPTGDVLNDTAMKGFSSGCGEIDSSLDEDEDEIVAKH